MNKSGFVLKASAVVSAVVLASGFIGYRAGAFHRLGLIGAPPPAPEAAPAENLSTPSNPVEDFLFYGSKSAPVFVPMPTTPQPAPTPIAPATLMPGSKSIRLVPLDPPASQVPPPSSQQSQPAGGR